MGDPMMSTPQVQELSGATKRQLDHWVRRGWLRPGRRAGVARHGHERMWDEGEAAAAHVMAMLVRGGMTPAAAQVVARAVLAPDYRGTLWLGPGVRLQVDVPVPHTRPTGDPR